MKQGAWAVVTFVVAGFLAGCTGPARLVRGPYLQQATPTGMTLVWRTHRPAQPVVRFGEADGPLNRECPAEAILLRVSPDSRSPYKVPRLSGAPPRTFQYEARLEGLKPQTKYLYEVLDGAQVLAGGNDCYFATAPAATAAVHTVAWVLGDSGTGGAAARNVYQSMLDYTATNGGPVDLMLHLGDMAYWDGTDEQFQQNFFGVYGPTLRHTVCWPTLGNHEAHMSQAGGGPYFDAYVLPTHGEAGGAPSGTEAYYSFNHGAIHFIVLDSNIPPAGGPDEAMVTWLKKDLSSAAGAWRVAFFHHAPYTKGSHDSDLEPDLIAVREQLMPVLEEGGVDLILAGHSHIYERSMLIDGAYQTPTRAEGVVLDDRENDYTKPVGIHPHGGTLVAVVGNGGAQMYQRGRMPIMRKTIMEYGSLLLAFDDTRLSGTMINSEGRVRDTFSLVKRGGQARTAQADPWQPFGPKIEPTVPLFLDRVDVALTSLTHWPDEQMHYTLDGRAPTVFSPRYVQPFALTNDAVVRARAFDLGGSRTSPVSRLAYERLDRPLQPATPPGDGAEDRKPGLRYRYYEGTWSMLPETAGLQAVEEGVVPAPVLDVRHRDDDFALVFEGFLDVPTNGVYAFHLTSDDGSRLLIDKALVVDNDGPHPMRTVVGFAPLARGPHAIRLEFFEMGGAEGLALLYQGPGMREPKPVPVERWSYE